MIKIYVIFLIEHRYQQRMNKEKLLHNINNDVAVLEVLKNLKIWVAQVDVQVRISLKSECLKMKTYTSELLNLSLETTNSIVEDITELLQNKSNLLDPKKITFLIEMILIT